MNWPLLFAIAQFAVSSAVGVGLWLYATGRTSGKRAQQQDDGQESTLQTMRRIEATAITEAELLKALELERHGMRNEMIVAVGKCVSRELYDSESRRVVERVERVEKRVFNGGIASV